MAITLTENAAKHVQNFLAKRGKGVGLRLGVRTSGCSGHGLQARVCRRSRARKTAVSSATA